MTSAATANQRFEHRRPGSLARLGTPVLATLILAAWLSPPAWCDPASKPLRVQSRLSSAPYYVGQAVTLQISVVAQSERPTIVPPTIAGADVAAVGVDVAPISSSGIGNLVVAENLRYIYRYRIVPRRAGVLTIPVVTVRLGERSGQSGLLRMTVAAVPEAGRPGAFLGGVGPFEVAAEADPPRIRIGQSVDYRLRITGPAALGAVQTPSLARALKLNPGLRIEPGAVEFVSVPPSRTFPFRLRPRRAGPLVLPPAAVASFDPTFHSFVTKVTPSVTIEVVDVPRFDPATLAYSPPAPVESTWPRRAATCAGVLTLCMVPIVVGAAVRRRRSQQRRRSHRAGRRVLKRLLREWDDRRPASEAGRRVTQGLVEYLALVQQRPRGVLTPIEARDAIAMLGDAALGERAGRLVADCDRAQYATKGPTTEALLGDTTRLVESLYQVGRPNRGS